MNTAGPLRILQVVGSLDRSWGGLSLYVAELAAELSAQGHHVQVVCQPGEPKERWPSGNVEVISAAAGSQEWVVAREAADLIHVHGLWLPFCHRALAGARRRNQPHLLSVHGMLEPGALGFSRWKKRLALMVYQGRDLRLTRALHATAEPERQTLRDFGLRQPIAILPPGVRLPSVELTSSREGEGRRALFLGRIHPKKGLLNLLEAWSVVHPVDWKLDLAGPDESGHLKEVLRVLKERKLEGKVIYHGPAFDTTKEDLLRGSSLLVVPSLSENFGIVVAEGLAHGLPVITTQGTPWKALEQEDCGWWIPFGTEPLVKVLREATALPPEKLAEKGRRGRALAERDFSWQRIGVRMAKTYDWLLGRGERPVWVQTTEKGHCELPVVVHS